MTSIRHVIGHSWREGTPTLHVWVLPGNGFGALELAGELCLTPLAARRCVGGRDGGHGGRVPCPDAAPLARGTQCDRCRAADPFRFCIACYGVRCPPLQAAAARYCRSVHHLYLMDIGGAAIKVGTAVDGRERLRVIEQGPLAAALVAAGPGPQIKRLEKAAARLGLRERFAPRQKAALVFGAADPDASRARLVRAYATVRAGVPADLAALIHAPEFLDPRPAAAGAAGLRPGVPIRPIPVRPGGTIRGQVRAVRGAFALLAPAGQDGVLGVLDLAALRARLIDLVPAAPAALPAAQLRLL